MEGSKDKSQCVEIAVILLDHTELTFQVNKRDRGQVLLDAVVEKVKCKEPKYYGLQFPQDDPDSMKWLDPSKSIRKQFKRGYPLLLYHRIKYYIFDVNRMRDPSTRYQLFLQVKLEILEQRLICPEDVAVILASYAVQSEIGDFHPEKHRGRYLATFKLVPNQTEQFEFKVQKHHKLHRGLSPVQAELLYLQKAKNISTYGVDMHYGKTSQGQQVEVGITTDGISLFENGQLRNRYEWSEIIKISFKRKQFYIQLRKDKVKEDGSMIEFSMDNYRACKRLWKSCVDCHSFYRHDREKILGDYKKQGGTPGRGEKPVFGFFTIGGKNKAKYDKADKETLKFRNPQKSISSKMLNSSNLLFSKDTYFTQDIKETRRLSAPPSVTLAVVPPNQNISNSLIDQATNFQFDQPYLNHDSSAPDISLPSGYELQDSYYDSAFQQPPSVGQNNNVPEHYVLPDNLTLIRLKPDKEGRFGFNIKGGHDQNMPITVSKIAPSSPADTCIPTLNIGDEILQINGRDANSLDHEQAVHFIRATREKYYGELVLLIRPEMEYDESTYSVLKPAEPPEIDELSVSQDCDTLETSMAKLKVMLDEERDMRLFDKLYRKKSGLTIKDAKLPSNAPRNRYRDISPYDKTRVKLSNWETDYINASHITMKIESTDITNHYIACQGPLHNTTGDFWAMIWQYNSSLIVMVTTTVERGMLKCSQYWPDDNCSLEFNNLTVTTVSEKRESCFIFREMDLSCSVDEEVETRRISHIQYTAWPDHGVPDDSSDFLDFILNVRQKRIGATDPTVVHCSAGIGRTGVMIAMETAMCLIEANQPVSPLRITQVMRDQRAMMIQTAIQFRFVCNAILRVYEAGLAQPMDAAADVD